MEKRSLKVNIHKGKRGPIDKKSLIIQPQGRSLADDWPFHGGNLLNLIYKINY